MAFIRPRACIHYDLQIGTTAYRIMGPEPLSHAPLCWPFAWCVLFPGSLAYLYLKLGCLLGTSLGLRRLVMAGACCFPLLVIEGATWEIYSQACLLGHFDLGISKHWGHERSPH